MATYRPLRSQAELDAAFGDSSARPVVLFKHSLTCPISSGALRRFEDFLARHGDGVDAEFVLIEVQPQRDLSNAVAARTGVRHESPQAIVLRDGQAVWNASHYAITVDALLAALPARSNGS